MKEIELDVRWFNSGKFQKFIKSVPVERKTSGKKILDIFYKSTGHQSPVLEVSGMSPIFFYGNYVYFHVIPKGAVSLQGFYLNVDACQLEYRESPDEIYMKKGFLSLFNNNRFKVTYGRIFTIDIPEGDRVGLCR